MHKPRVSRPMLPSGFRPMLDAVALAVALLPFAATAASPDLTDLPLEDLLRIEITSASKFSQAPREAPSAVQVISAEEIRRHGWRTLGEALASLPGMYRVSDGAYDFVGARGFLVPGDLNTRFLLLLDGQRLNDNIYEQASFSREFVIDLAMIERIEYVPGPGSSIYGSNALFGVVNVITRRVASMPARELATEFSSDGWRGARFAATSGNRSTGPNLVTSLSHARKLGQDRTYPAGLLTADGTPSVDGVAHGLDKATVTRGFVGLTNAGWSLSAWGAKRVVVPSSALYETNFDDDRLRIEDAQFGLSAAYSAAITEALDFNGRVSYQKVTYRADYPYFDEEGAGAYINRDDSLGTWVSGEARVLFTGATSHKLVAGVDFQSDIEATQKNFDVDVAIDEPLDVHTRNRRRGVYVQDEWHFASAWRLNAGLRRDDYSSAQGYTSPRLGLLWDVSERLTLKLLSGRAYRAPSAYEAAFANGINYLANPGLAPETIRTVEAVAEYRPAAGHQIGASYFDYRLRDPIRQVDTGDGVLQYQNQASITAKGVETYYRVSHRDGWQLLASLALTRAQDEFGDWPGNSPHWLAKLHAGTPLWGQRMYAALELQATGRRIVDRAGERSALGSQFLVNASLAAMRLAPGLEARLRVVNLLDRALAHPGSDEAPVALLPVDDRRLELGLSYAF